MLLSFRVANHRSLRSEQQLLLTPSYRADGPSDVDWEGVPVVGLFGPNASGKSNVIDAMVYMRDLVLGSLRESEPGAGVRRQPFALGIAARDEPSTFVVDLMLERVQYTYGFSVDDAQVTEEWMYSYPQKRKRLIFRRALDEYSFGDSPDSMRQVEEITESNVLFLSVAARSRQVLVRPVYDWFADIQDRKPLVAGSLRPAVMTAEALERFGYFDRLTTLLQAADTGIESAELIEETDAEFAERAARLDGLDESRTATGRAVRLAEISRRGKRRKHLVFRHRGETGTFALGLRDQSLGTRALYEMGLPVFISLDQGSSLIVDELDSSLHPYLSAQIIRLFTDSATNPLGAQLIFTSHDPTLLGRIQGAEVLHRDHIWFTEKNECGATEIFPLSDFNPRRDENRERRYLAGRYGAVPIVNDELFAAALSTREEGDDGFSGAYDQEGRP
ncbi:AAA family ATPase [Sphaerisporangium corydalis]|uniref:ATP/GTP-binding protein n=1 Tax=Sphaerisporangium corydalis TaxID=1441875 RepID=A0ABV9ETU5_9ACTN|nr:ATP-binding protein [Sphaerisporangium corydalis]